MSDLIVFQSISSFSRWRVVFSMALDWCNEYEVIFPEGEYDPENRLMTGKPEFESLPHTHITPWNGMANSIVIRGNLNKEVRKLFIELEEPIFRGEMPGLWYIKLLKNGKLYLTVEDFTVCLIVNNSELIMLIKQKGINLEDL